MLEFPIELPNENGGVTVYPIMIKKESVLNAFFKKEGIAFEIIKEFLKEAKKDNNDITRIKIKEIEKLLKEQNTKKNK